MFNSIVEAIKENSITFPDKKCLIDSSGEYTYKEYFELISKIAKKLSDDGIKKKERIVIKSSQTVLFLATLHAIHLIGAVAVPLEKTVKEERVLQVYEEAEAVLFITDKALPQVKSLEYSAFDNLENAELKDFPESMDDSTILFTTGTTGKSKGILLSHGADVAVAENVIDGTKMKKDNIEVLPMPLNHSFSLRRYYANMINASTVILLNGVIFVKKFFDCFDKYGACSAAMAPSALSIIFKLSGEKISEYNDKIDYIQFGGSYMQENEKAEISRLLPDVRLYNFYGSTEAGCSCITDFNKNNENPHNIGKPTVNSIIKFVDEFDNEINTDEDHPARLITGGTMIMNEYINNPEITAETLKNGFIYSNDLGYFDENGDVIMLGRIDDVIVCGGQKISPVEIEDVCNRYDGIDECAVIGVDDELMGQIAKLFIVTNDRYNEADLVQFLNDRLEGFQVPKVIQVIKEIPKTFNGKPLKRELKNL